MQLPQIVRCKSTISGLIGPNLHGIEYTGIWAQTDFYYKARVKDISQRCRRALVRSKIKITRVMAWYSFFISL